MPTFDGSLQIAGDASTKMPAGIRVDGGRLIVLAGPSDEIGNWSLRGLDIRRRSGAFLLTVEGEQLLISVDNPEAFTRLIDLVDDAPKASAERRGTKQKKERRPKKERSATKEKRPRKERSTAKDRPSRKERRGSTPAPEATPEPDPVATPEPESRPETRAEPSSILDRVVEAQPSPTFEAHIATFEPDTPPSKPETVAEPAKTKPPKKQKAARPSRRAKPEGGVSLLAALPLSWKVGAAVVVGAVVLGIFAPGVLTAILMLAGMVALLLAVVVDTDSIAAARLPAAMTSTNTLVVGIILLVLSALMMVIA